VVNSSLLSVLCSLLLIRFIQAGEKAKALALRVLAERMENEVSIPAINCIEFANHYGQNNDL